MPRNFVILNGVASLQIKGLLIQELPPITKPPIRHNIEEIDGVDGDRTELLGYGAYDKEMLIGLHGDFDIDEVIDFFDSSGEVVFSNEIDKFYKYQILQQIDFERLLRFRVATVVFHVQPFKHSSVERRVITAANEAIEIPDAHITQDGILVVAEDGVVSIGGSCVFPTEVYIPIAPAVLQAGSYTLTLTASGQSMDGVTMRLLRGAPTDGNTFGGQELHLESGTITTQATIAGTERYDMLYLFIPPQQPDIELTVSLTNDSYAAKIRNSGNVYSRPIWSIFGSGDITLQLNGSTVMSIALGNLGGIVIDCEKLDAYSGSELRNRICTGNYEDMFLQPGVTLLTWTGDVSKITIQDYSRWI
jgi:phage-related protein